jgi:heme/copper-type cytochrome/quinol oxidase subunit 2
MKPAIAFVSVFVAVGFICAAVFDFVPIHERAGTGSTLRVRAVAHEWWWEFEYPSLGVRTTDVLYSPSNSEIQLELLSGDVIHSFWVAGMRKSVYIIPGKARLLNIFVKSPGDLSGNCDSGCGCGAVCMRFRLLARVPLEFQRWAAKACLHQSKFKVPQAAEIPASAIVTAQDGHMNRNSLANRLQQLLDKSSTADRLLH